MSTNYRDLVDEGWIARIKRLAFDDLHLEGEALLAEMEELRAAYGGSLNGVKGKDAKRLREIIGQIEVLGEVKARTPNGYTPQPSGPHAGGALPATPGWKAGHWSTPLLKSLGGSMAGGFKDLAPNGAVSVPALTTGIVGMGDRPQRLLEVIPR